MDVEDTLGWVCFFTARCRGGRGGHGGHSWRTWRTWMSHGDHLYLKLGKLGEMSFGVKVG